MSKRLTLALLLLPLPGLAQGVSIEATDKAFAAARTDETSTRVVGSAAG